MLLIRKQFILIMKFEKQIQCIKTMYTFPRVPLLVVVDAAGKMWMSVLGDSRRPSFRQALCRAQTESAECMLRNQCSNDRGPQTRRVQYARETLHLLSSFTRPELTTRIWHHETCSFSKFWNLVSMLTAKNSWVQSEDLTRSLLRRTEPLH